MRRFVFLQELTAWCSDHIGSPFRSYLALRDFSQFSNLSAADLDTYREAFRPLLPPEPHENFQSFASSLNALLSSNLPLQPNSSEFLTVRKHIESAWMDARSCICSLPASEQKAAFLQEIKNRINCIRNDSNTPLHISRFLRTALQPFLAFLATKMEEDPETVSWVARDLFFAPLFRAQQQLDVSLGAVISRFANTELQSLEPEIVSDLKEQAQTLLQVIDSMDNIPVFFFQLFAEAIADLSPSFFEKHPELSFSIPRHDFQLFHTFQHKEVTEPFSLQAIALASIINNPLAPLFSQSPPVPASFEVQSVNVTDGILLHHDHNNTDLLSEKEEERSTL